MHNNYNIIFPIGEIKSQDDYHILFSTAQFILYSSPFIHINLHDALSAQLLTSELNTIYAAERASIPINIHVYFNFLAPDSKEITLIINIPISSDTIAEAKKEYEIKFLLPFSYNELKHQEVSQLA